MKYDVVVVGARIGGSTASLFASKKGLDVLMIEKKSGNWNSSAVC
nr:NAD(P)-binding protein [Methanobacterium formicicum]